MLVFVYGTLKRGEPNHCWLTDDKNGCAKFLMFGKTASKYPLVIGSEYNIPFLLKPYDEFAIGHNVIGEVYDVDEKMLSNLDVLEQHPTFYRREEISIATDDGNLLCWTYFLVDCRPELLKLPFLTEYSNEGSHGLRYVESEEYLESIS
ncbi:putative gamma-glutamylcyclotransferase CG2811 isoform X2 [Artemia franciscana]|uniref:putative gamma-glutamylcyclotransferase CG2811 isoform X2 n=1 Tax=Artemia franciscana TaxID=6661 RepID=UPI0032DB8C21